MMSRNLFLPFLICIAFATAGHAQRQENLAQDLNGMSVVLDTIAAALEREGLTDDQVSERRLQAIEISNRAQSIANALQPSIVELVARRDTLKSGNDTGEENASDPAESDNIIREREQTEASLAAVQEQSKRAAAIATRGSQLAGRAATIERERFNRQIFQRDRSVLAPSLWRSALTDFPDAVAGIERVFGDIAKRVASKGIIGLLPPLLFLLSLCLVIIPGLRHGMVNLIAARFGHHETTELGKAVVACLVVLFVMLVPLAGFFLTRWAAQTLDLTSPNLESIMDRIGIAILIMSASIGFSRAILAPNRPDWRLARASENEARALAGHIRSAVAIIAGGVVLQGVADVANVPQPLIVLVGGLIGIAFAWTLWMALKPYRSNLGDDSMSPGSSRMKYAAVLRFISMSGFLSVAVIVGAVLLGYVPLAWFLSKQVVWIGIVFASYALIANLIDSASDVVLSPDGSPSAWIAGLTGMRRPSVAQFGIVGFGFIKLFLVGIGVIAVAAPWGFESVSIFEQAHSLLTGFRIGGINISLSTIAGGIIVFVVSLVLARSFKTWLGEHLLPATSLDTGLKNSISTTIGYVGFIASVVIAFGFVGIDLSQLGLVAGALSVGIGFGLQSIVNNFVSGLILLAERPIKAGDWIIVGGEEGTVKKINVRATELETFDRASVVIPNSDLISGTVRNWVLGGTMGRSSLVIGVGYNSDADQVRELLLSCAEDNELVLAYPEPAVFFLDFGDSALQFRLDVYLSDIGNGFRVRSELRFEILRRFRDAGVEIPFPQRDLNIRSSDEMISLIDRIKP